MPELGRISRICLECAAIFGHLPLTGRCRLGDYTRTMMIKRILTICAALTAGAAGTSLATSLALAQSYPPPPGPIYSQSPAPYPPGGYVVDERRGPGAPDFDGLDDDDAPNGRGPTELAPPGPPPVYSDRGGPQGPILSPNDPRYGRPDGPVYSDRGGPQGPILSPNHPPYRRPA